MGVIKYSSSSTILSLSPPPTITCTQYNSNLHCTPLSRSSSCHSTEYQDFSIFLLLLVELKTIQNFVALLSYATQLLQTFTESTLLFNIFHFLLSINLHYYFAVWGVTASCQISYTFVAKKTPSTHTHIDIDMYRCMYMLGCLKSYNKQGESTKRKREWSMEYHQTRERSHC